MAEVSSRDVELALEHQYKGGDIAPLLAAYREEITAGMGPVAAEAAREVVTKLRAELAAVTEQRDLWAAQCNLASEAQADALSRASQLAEQLATTTRERDDALAQLAASAATVAEPEAPKRGKRW